MHVEEYQTQQYIGSPVQEVTPVHHAVAVQKEALGALDNALSDLEKRLIPILRPENLADIAGKLDAKREAASPHAEVLLGHADTMGVLHRRLTSLLDRIEI